MKSGQGIYCRYIKRILDIVCALAVLVCFSWLYAILALLVRSRLGSPVLFTQLRPGKNERIFKMYKFRSMTDARDENGELLPDDVRLTKFGKLLRSTSLDELPEFWNILKGDMSLVGPRPQLVRDMVFMTPEQRQRHTVLPGLTGLAQVSGRNAISWEDKLSTDLKYVQKITFWGDVKIILLTMKKVFCREDISAVGMETAEDFGDYLLHSGQISESNYQNGQEESRQLLQMANK